MVYAVATDQHGLIIGAIERTARDDTICERNGLQNWIRTGLPD
jgi:hypothetical protein